MSERDKWDPEGDTARYHPGRASLPMEDYPGRPAFIHDRKGRQSPPLTWPHVGLVAVIALALVAVAFACAWGIKG